MSLPAVVRRVVSVVRVGISHPSSDNTTGEALLRQLALVDPKKHAAFVVALQDTLRQALPTPLKR